MIFPWIVLLVEGLLCKAFLPLGFTEDSIILALFVILINSISVIFAIFHLNITKKMALIILSGFLIRVICFYFDLNCRSIFVLPNSGLDTESFALWAKNGFLTGDYMRGGNYAKFISIWYFFFGIQRPIAQYVNILFYVSSSILMIRIFRILKLSISTQNLSLSLFSFLPNTIIINSILLRESAIVFFVTYSIFMFLKYLKFNKISYLLVSFILGIVGASFHSGVIGLIAGYGVVLILYNKNTKTIRLNKNSIFKLAAFLIFFFVLYSSFDSLFSKFGNIENAQDIIDTADKYNAGGSAYSVGFSIGNPYLNMLVNTPFRMFYFLTSPLPWLWRNLTDIIAFLFSSLLYLYIIYQVFVSKKKKYLKNEVTNKILLIICICCVLVFAWGVSNSGTALRHREKFLTVFIILFALNRDTINSKIKNIKMH